MIMEFTFDKDKVEEAGYTMESIYSAMKDNFKKNGLRCIDSGEVLTFGGTGTKDDYGKMLIMMGVLSSQGWFMYTVSSWVFRKKDSREDVLKHFRDGIAKGDYDYQWIRSAKAANY